MTELFLYSFLLIVILIAFVKLYGMKKVSFLRILLTLMMFNCFQGIYSGSYWWDYTPGPYPDVDPDMIYLWGWTLGLAGFTHKATVDLTLWLVSWKFYCSASQLKVIEDYYSKKELKSQKNKKALSPASPISNAGLNRRVL